MVASVTPCFFRKSSHQLERRLAVSPWLNEDVQDLAFAVHGTPDVQGAAVDGDEHFVEMPPALSHYRWALARLCSEHAHQAAAVTTCHVLSASPRNWRSV